MRYFLIFIMMFGFAKAQELRGHGGPVRAMALNGHILASGSFDQTIILWDLKKNTANSVLRGHEGSVNALLWLDDKTLVSGGDDGRVIWWRDEKPVRNEKVHEAQVTALAVSPNGTVASSSFDGTVVFYGDKIQKHKTNSEKIVGLAFHKHVFVTLGDTGDLSYYSTDNFDYSFGLKSNHPSTSLVVAGDETSLLGLNSGEILILNKKRQTIPIGNAPVIALALSKDKNQLAAATIGGTVTIVDLTTHTKLFSLVGPGLPVWSVIFNDNEIITGGGDRLIRRWDRKTGEHIGAVLTNRDIETPDRLKNHKGAEVFKACVFCHSLSPHIDNLAGPSLYNIIGSKVGSRAQYNYSDALRKDDTVWTREKIKRLFEIGPNAYFPGTKMPEQIITSDSDREALVDYLEKMVR